MGVTDSRMACPKGTTISYVKNNNQNMLRKKEEIICLKAGDIYKKSN
jgi:hypothetical protein